MTERNEIEKGLGARLVLFEFYYSATKWDPRLCRRAESLYSIAVKLQRVIGVHDTWVRVLELVDVVGFGPRRKSIQSIGPGLGLFHERTNVFC